MKNLILIITIFLVSQSFALEVPGHISPHELVKGKYNGLQPVTLDFSQLLGTWKSIGAANMHDIFEPVTYEITFSLPGKSSGRVDMTVRYQGEKAYVNNVRTENVLVSGSRSEKAIVGEAKYCKIDNSDGEWGCVPTYSTVDLSYFTHVDRMLKGATSLYADKKNGMFLIPIELKDCTSVANVYLVCMTDAGLLGSAGNSQYNVFKRQLPRDPQIVPLY